MLKPKYRVLEHSPLVRGTHSSHEEMRGRHCQKSAGGDCYSVLGALGVQSGRRLQSLLEQQCPPSQGELNGAVSSRGSRKQPSHVLSASRGHFHFTYSSPYATSNVVVCCDRVLHSPGWAWSKPCDVMEDSCELPLSQPPPLRQGQPQTAYTVPEFNPGHCTC